MPRPSLIAAVLFLIVAACSSSQQERAGTITKPVEGDPSPNDGRDSSDDDSSGTPTPTSGPIGPIGGGGNQRIRSFDEAKRALTQIYASHRIDLYCGCAFAPEKGKGLRVDLTSCGYVVAKEPIRAARIEWEHAVPASWFGKTFSEWTQGSDKCVDGKGKHFKGRKCAEVSSAEFARIEGDMHNLFPVVGEVNALRLDFPMGHADATHHGNDVFRFGACTSVVDHGVFYPREDVRGDLARASLYMDKTYADRHLLDDDQRALFQKWSVLDPPDAWERERNRVIAGRQGSSNSFIDEIPER